MLFCASKKISAYPCKSQKMKTIFTFSLLPVIVLAYFFSTRLYINAEYVPAYALVAICFFSTVLCIRNVGQLLQSQRG